LIKQVSVAAGDQYQQVPRQYNESLVNTDRFSNWWSGDYVSPYILLYSESSKEKKHKIKYTGQVVFVQVSGGSLGGQQTFGVYRVCKKK